jgi:electron transfer flavoprotein-quinone oxidoreductase
MAAAIAITSALKASDYSDHGLSGYRAELDRTFVGADFRTYAKAPAFLENPRMYSDYGQLLADVFHGIYAHDLTPRKHLVPTAMGAVKASRLKLGQLMRDGWAAARAL